MQIYIFNKELNRLGLIDSFDSLIWNRKSQEVGDFELHCPLNGKTLELLKEGNIICKSNDLTECAYIENIYLDEEIEETIKVVGKFISGYMGKRIIWNTENINTTVENAMYYLVSKNCIDTEPNRVIPMFKIDNSKGYTDKIKYQVSYKVLEDEIVKLAKEKDLNFKVTTDIENKIHTFKVIKGIDRTVNQNTNSFCIFSKEFDNIHQQLYSNEVDDFKNVALIGGEGQGSERKFITIGSEAIGLDRNELYVDADDIQSKIDEETSIPESDYLDLLKQRGLIKLDEHKRVECFSTTINVNDSNLVYKKDFDLGDYVTCVNKKWKKVIDVKITEIQEIYEKNNTEVNVTFGNKVPTIIEKIKRR